MPRSKEDFQKLQEERRTAILYSALRLFALRGYDSVSIDDITKDAKCSHGLFYHYFDSKEDLFNDMMIRIKEKWADTAKLDFSQKPKFIIRELIDFYLEKLNMGDDIAYMLFFFLTFHFQKKLPIAGSRHEKPKKDKLFYKVIDVVKRGQEEGEFQEGDPREYAIVFFSCLKGLTHNRIHLGKKVFFTPKAETLMNLFIRKDIPNA
ncbi:MAG: TetR/AcrR family transcriptional regulator [Erysipelotrichaceae bacterium]|nr:TetR/AcrR family transcriptional regulator [Erysipelotrichaceae bacterium]